MSQPRITPLEAIELKYKPDRLASDCQSCTPDMLTDDTNTLVGVMINA